MDTSANKGILTMSMWDDYMDKHIDEYCTFEDNTFGDLQVIQKPNPNISNDTSQAAAGLVNSHDETYFEDQGARNAFMDLAPQIS